MNDVLIIAGEKSGEEHALSFLPKLKRSLPEVKFYGVGGDLLKEFQIDLLYHLNDFSSMGFTEVIKKLPFYIKAMKNILNEVDKRKTKIAILIDFQGFNLKLASKLKKKGVKVLYYVAPQAWAWKEKRVKTLKESVDTLFTILPFEKEWFEGRGLSQVVSVPHPLLVHYKNELKNFKREEEITSEPRILLLPGSRSFEVSSLLPVFFEALKLLKEDGLSFKVGIVQSTSVEEKHYQDSNFFYDKIFKSTELIEAFKWAHLAIASSGTVTLSTGLFSLPTIVCYKLNYINEFIATNLVSYKGPVSLTNIIHHNQYIFPEFLMYKANRYNIYHEAKAFLTNKKKYSETIKILDNTKALMGGDNSDASKIMELKIRESL